MCCCNNSQPRLCKSSWRQPAESQQSQYLFPFFIGWVWLLRGCSEVCRAHLTAARAELLYSHLYLRKKWDSPLLLWAHWGIFNTSVGDAVSSAIISPWQLHKHCWGWSSAQHVEETVWSAGHWEAYFFLWEQDTSVFHLLQKGRCMRKKKEHEESSPLRLHGIARGAKQTTFWKITLWWMSLPLLTHRVGWHQSLHRIYAACGCVRWVLTTMEYQVGMTSRIIWSNQPFKAKAWSKRSSAPSPAKS